MSWLAWLTTAAVAVGYAVGVHLSRQLAALGYRIDTEEGAPPPRALWAVAPAVSAMWGLLAWHLGDRHGGVELPAYLVLATVGVALARIDADVHRLPSGLTFPTAAAVAALLVISSALSGAWSSLVTLTPARRTIPSAETIEAPTNASTRASHGAIGERYPRAPLRRMPRMTSPHPNWPRETRTSRR